MRQSTGTLTHKRWFCALLIMSVLVVAAVPALANTYGIVRNPYGGNSVNVREWGSFDAPTLCCVCVGTQVQIARQDGEWYSVWVNGIAGYIHSSFVSTGRDDGSYNPGKSGKAATVTTGPVNLRETPSTHARVITQLYSGESVSVLSYGDTWTQIRVGDFCGYVLTRYLSIGGSRPAPAPAPAPKPIAPTYTDGANATVRTFNGGNLNLRTWASSSSAVIASVGYGARIKILTHGATWCKVQVGNLVGYMTTKYLAFDGGWTIDQAKANATTKRGYSAVVSTPYGSSLNLRSEPSSSSYSLGQYYNGAKVTVLAAGKEWHRVSVNGTVGYMMAKYVQFTSKVASPDKTVSNNGSFVNLRSGAGYGFSVLKKVQSGAAATVVVSYPTWSKVIVKDGTGFMTGYMVNNFLR